MIRIKIDVKKISKQSMFVGAKGTYLDLTLMDNREGTDEYGNDGFVVQDIGKERREVGEKGPILGNWKYVGERPKPAAQPPASKTATADSLDEDLDDDIPF